MTDTKTATFKMSRTEKSPDSLYGEEILALRIEKVNQKATLLSILLPCIVGILILIAYLDLRGRVADLQSAKQNDVQVLTEDLEKRLENIKKEYAKLESSLDKKISYIDKNTYLLKENLEKSEKTLKNLKSSKADKKEQQALVSQIDNKIVPIEKNVSDISKQIQSLDTKIQDLTKSVDKSNTNISELSNNKMDKDSLDIKLLNDQKLYQQQLNELKKDLNSKISTLQTKINSLGNISSTNANTPPPKNISEDSINEEE